MADSKKTNDNHTVEADADSVVVRCGAAARDWILGRPEWLRYQFRRPLTVLILGMHRSGTSFLARVINLCGASFGGEVIPPNDWNRAGHWESHYGLAINDLILRLSAGAWDIPVQSLYCDTSLRWKMKRFLGHLHRDGTAVWKDPRLTLTFPIWKPFLKNYRILATFRHPMSVAQSLHRRDEFSIDKGLRLWQHYNHQLLNICATDANVAWIDFDEGPAKYGHVLERFITECGLTPNPEAFGHYHQALRTSDSQKELESPEIGQLYSQLKERFRASARL